MSIITYTHSDEITLILFKIAGLFFFDPLNRKVAVTNLNNPFEWVASSPRANPLVRTHNAGL